MTNLLDYKKNWDYASEEELTKIYQEQYNDVFSKILLLTGTQFMNVLEKQIITYLYITKRQPILSLLTRISEYFTHKYYEDREKAYEAYQIIKEANINDLEFLDKFNCYLHCPYTGEAFHTCGNKFILCNDLIFCLQCKKVYNEEQAKMLCDFCKVEYYTKLREVENEEFETFFPVSFENAHCENEIEEKIKCKNCKEDLFIDISKFNNGNKIEKTKKIENLYCLKCKQNFKIKELDSKCSKCNKKFYSDIKIYNEFNNIKIDYFCLVHTLLKRKYASPKNIKKRACKCEPITPKKFKHNLDKGILLEGLRYGKKVIICNKCLKIFNYYNFNWNCPECGIVLNANNNLLSKELSDSSSVSYKIEQEKSNLKQNSKYNTAASGIKTKNIFGNPNKSEIKNGKIIDNNNDKKNIEYNDINNSKMLRNSQKAGNNFTDRHSKAINVNNTFDKENKKNSNNTKDNKINNYNTNINSNRNITKESKKLFSKVYINENNQLINSTDKNNQTGNLLINSVNSSIKLKNNFNDKNYNNNNNKTAIITFNENNFKEKNDYNKNLNNKSTIGKDLDNSNPENKNEKIDYSLRYNNKDNKESNNLKNNKERITSIDIIKNDNKSKKSYNYMNINEQINAISSKGNSKNKRKLFKNGEINETNPKNINSNNNNNYKLRRISNKDHINQNGNNNNNNNIIKIDLGKNNNILGTAKSSVNIHTTSNNIINNNIRNINHNNKQNLKVINEQNIKSPQKLINNGNNSNNVNQKQYDLAKQEIIKRNYSSDKNKQEKEDNNNQNNNKILSRRNKKNSAENNNKNNIRNHKQNNDNTDNHEDIKNNNIIKKNQSLNLIIAKNNNSLSKRKLNKVKINDNTNEENDKNSGDQIIQRNRGSPNHKRVDIVQTKNNNKNINKNININVKLSHELTNLNYNPLNRSQNGKEIKENKIGENIPVNRSINLVHSSSTEEEKNNNNKNINNNNSIDKNKKKRIDNVYKTSNNNSIGIIQQEDNEDDNSFDYNVTKSINYSSNKKNIELNQIQDSQQKNKLVENRYSNFNENNQIINENNIYIHDEKEEDKEKENIKEKDKEKDKEKNKEKEKEKTKDKVKGKSKEKEKQKEKRKDIEKKDSNKEKKDDSSSNPQNINLYQKNNSEDIDKNKLYAKNKESNKNISSLNNFNINDSSKNISSEGYQFNCDNYNIVHLLGEGTFGKIYLVEDPADSKKYALKKIAVSDMEELGENKKEFELLMKLSQDNPTLNVVKIFGIQVKKLDKFNLVMYVLMEAAQCDWENEIRNRNQYQAYYTEEELMKILTNLTTTLASLQKQGICHRDVKPQNILCFGKDNYKLSDFGEAKKKKKRKINGNCIYDFEGDTSKQTVRGTELYMSPILFKALHDCPEVDLEYNAYKSDVFSLGLCMLLSSTLGFQALYDIRELYDNNKIKKIVEKYLSSRYSKDYIKLITSMLQIKEKNRPDFIELETFIDNNYYHKNEEKHNNK